MSKCECSFRIKMLGDGCRYCNPQHYIDLLLEELTELRQMEEWLENNSNEGLCDYYNREEVQ